LRYLFNEMIQSGTRTCPCLVKWLPGPRNYSP
jgi:hypothetical protein